MPHPVIKIGHRGACGYFPENTLASFKKALECRADIIELDVYKCRSGELVAFHDKKLNRTTNGKGYITKKTLQQLKELDAGNGEKIPTIKEILDLVDKKCTINFELKGPGTLYPLLHLIEKYIHEKGWTYNHFIISSFQRSKLRKIHKRKPAVLIGALLISRSMGFLNFAKKINAYSVHVNKKIVTKDFIENARSLGLKTFIWTVNDPDEITYIKSLGADGIFSDFPDRV